MPGFDSWVHASMLRRIGYCLLPLVLGAGGALALLLLAGGPAREAFAGTLTYPGCGASIQACIDGANPGDTILISAGDYTESLTLSKAVSLTGELSSTTILHALPNTRVLTVTGATVNSSVVISGLTFTGGHAVAPFNCADNCGGGVQITGTAQPRLSNLRLMSNTAAFGAGLYAAGDLTVSDSSFVDNVIGSMIAGGGLYVQGVARVANCTFINNFAGQGGGLYALEATVSGSRFVGNQSSGIYAGHNVTVTDSSFVSNYGDSAGGGLFTNYGALVSGSQFISNYGANGGGLTAGHATVSDSRFVSNWGTYGGGLYAYVSATVSNSTFENNYVSGPGGGLYSNFSAAVSNSTFFSNTANEGGGLFARFVTLAESTFVSNTANEGGGLATGAGAVTATGTSFIGNIANSLSFGGGGIWMDGGWITLTDTRFISNMAQAGGGGVQLFGGSPGSRLVNSLFTRNRSAVGGADVDFHGASLLLLDNTIADPALAPGAALLVAGGSVGITDTIFASQTVAISVTRGSVFQDYNLFFGNGTNGTGAANGGAHSLVGDPAFRDPAFDDYHLTAASAARNHGVNVGVTTDFDGDPRPFGGGFDIGFDQYALKLFLALLRR